MPKLSKEYRFLDLSDYGRPAAVLIADHLKDSRLTPIHVTILFTISGLLAVLSILQGYYLAAGLFLILKSILDAADGELSRVKNTPSYTGRYLDSISDIILNFLILMAIGYKTNTVFFYSLIAFLAIQFQGTLYNYYYVILRNNSFEGDDTSRVFETKSPKAFVGESQRTVNLLFNVYTILYGLFDRIIYSLDKSASQIKNFPNWFMTLVSLYGLGFQLIVISIMLNLGLIDYIIPFFIYYTVLIALIVGIRKYFLQNEKQNLKLITQVDRLKLSRSKEHYPSQEMPLSKGILRKNDYEIKVLSSSTGKNKSNVRQTERI
ncbi:MAG: CDP-alcohol phosphatidyltransferase family protein [Ignavibacteriaceae bacterium]|nr:CDP-alcohol phosphatidyltransferase family protein [Ignavibacteriaceae bacterium]HRN26764.1 CDP-alcohol phosphatidyltransferase family protein [Ignavibacteriaceae bacterium]HRP92683.1 CDP-alcohol phosphatidyltransferase family protein [Ignavibacteriaceae bacterium]HRQ55705.1 CDP-alcohol phosphatidyltransferase family protein [Ignavibacteriaceae bacterium]